ncbi:Fe-Mn family superoxide dismutase [Simiduia aestuariiviva]|uniref:Superoxide dismutase n=1 Tax=Simiduia aestuariiviva TaxID=1510459 RepID=A0A839UU38_9GAMM|nr:Fe-Mn family superoxide dismutase [Simiduia aestuariiviva]MBB3169018.1 superoxide dismutase [Simiduia aestuariiviva]
MKAAINSKRGRLLDPWQLVSNSARILAPQLARLLETLRSAAILYHNQYAAQHSSTHSPAAHRPATAPWITSPDHKAGTAPALEAKSNIPNGKLFDAIAQCFGSFDQFKQRLEQENAKSDNESCVWLVSNTDNSVQLITTPRHMDPSIFGCETLLAIDICETSSPSQTASRQLLYIRAWWQVVSWASIEQKYEQGLYHNPSAYRTAATKRPQVKRSPSSSVEHIQTTMRM